MNAQSFTPSVSVIVPTYRRERILCETIQQLLQQDYPDYELIVVDQTPEHELETEKFLQNHEDKMRYFRLEPPSLPGARNFGVSQARGEIVIFVDDDVRVQQNWIRCHARHFADPDIGGVSGKVIEEGIPEVDTGEINRVTKWGRVIGNRSSSLLTEVEWASGGNSSFRHSLISQIDGFDESFAGNALFEDVDFSFRLRRLGKRIIFDPEAVIWHLSHAQGGCETRAQDRVNYYYWFMHNKTLFFTKNFPARYLPLLMMSNFARSAKTGLMEAGSLKAFMYLLSASIDGLKSSNAY